MWWLASAGGGAVVVTGLLPAHDALSVMRQVGPVLAFLVAITVIAELADAAAVFDVAARSAARLAGGDVRRLFALVVVLATVTTVLLSLDTTAVLLTPVVLALAAQLEVPAAPFAVITLWLANTASLLLPVSNLTNLLALQDLQSLHEGSVARFAARMALPFAVSVLGTVLVVGFRHRRDVRGRYLLPALPAVGDRALLVLAGAVCLGVGPLFVSGLDVAVVAVVGALVLVAAFAVRRPQVLRPGLVPWRLVLLVLGLFLVVQAATVHGLDALLVHLAGTGDEPPDLVRVAVTGAAGSNVVNNLPAYLALAPVAHDSAPRLLALLVGTNVGPLVLPWASLATLLWRERCRARGVVVPTRDLVLLGLAGAPLLVVCSTLAVSVPA